MGNRIANSKSVAQCRQDALSEVIKIISVFLKADQKYLLHILRPCMSLLACLLNTKSTAECS